MSPRPPAPGSLAPGLPLPRRPAPRHLLAVIALAVLLIAAAVPAVSAETITGNIYDPQYEMHEYPSVGSDATAFSYAPLNKWYIYCSDISAREWPTQIVLPNALIYQSDEEYASTKNYRVYNGTLTDNNNKVYADLQVEYQKIKYDVSKSHAFYTVVVNLDWDYTALNSLEGSSLRFGFSGDGLNYDSSSTAILFGVDRDIPVPTTRLEFDAYTHKLPYSELRYMQYYVYLDTFEQSYTISTDENGINIDLIRVINGKSNPSKIIVTNLDGSPIYESQTHIDSNGTYHYPNTDVVVALESLYTAQRYEIYRGTSGPGPNPDLGGLTLTLTPATATVNSPVTAALSTSAATPRYSEITYAITDPAGNVAYDTYSLDQETWTTWQHYNKTSWQFDPSSETDAHHPVITPTSAGTWTVTATIRDRRPPGTGEALASVSASCEVSRAAGNVDVAISIYDGASSSTPLLYGVGVLVEDLTTNGTVLLDTREYRLDGWTGTTNGRVTVQAPLGHQIRVTAQKQGYVTRAQTDYVQPTAVPLNQMPVNIVLSPATTPGPEQVYLTVLVTDLRSQPIQGATVTAAGKAGTTGAQGTCRLSVPLNQTISWIVRADGYHGASGIALPLDANSQMTVQLQPDIPTTPGPGGPGATPTPDTRTNEQKGQAIIDLIADFAEPIAILAILATIFGLMKMMTPGRR